MGNEQPKNKNQQQVKQLDRVKLEVACLKVKGYLELNRDRRINQALNKETALNQLMKSPSRVRVDEYQKLSSLVVDVNYIEACNLVIRCVDVLKDQSMRICQSTGDPTKIPDLMPYVETILWSSQHLNLQAVQEFRDLMIVFFGPVLYEPSKLQCVDPELKNLFKGAMPDALEINAFALKFAEKYGINIEQLNAPGHMFSDKYLPQNQFPPCNQIGLGGAPNYGGGQGQMNINIQIDNPYGQPQQHSFQIPQGGIQIPQQPAQNQPPYGISYGQPANQFGQPFQPYGQPPQQPAGYGQPPNNFMMPPNNLGQPINSQPANQPPSFPGNQPPSFPGNQPPSFPGNQPTSFPGNQPPSFPGNQPPSFPGNQPPSYPGNQPTSFPGNQPTSFPGNQPPSFPGNQPTSFPGNQPPSFPNGQPSNNFGQPSSNLPNNQPSNDFPTNNFTKPQNYPSFPQGPNGSNQNQPGGFPQQPSVPQQPGFQPYITPMAPNQAQPQQFPGSGPQNLPPQQGNIQFNQLGNPMVDNGDDLSDFERRLKKLQDNL